MAIKGKITSTSTEAAEDGSQTFFIEVHGFGEIAVEIPENDLVETVARVQSIFLERRSKMSQPPHYPMLDVDDAHIAHGSDQTALMVATEQMGSLALRLTPEIIRRMREALDDLEQAIPQRSNPN